MEIYEKVCKVIELYNNYKGNLNDDGTVATDEQIAEWIVPSLEEEINEDELDNLAELFTPVELITHYNLSISKEQVDIIKDCFKAGFKLAKKEE